MHGETDEAASDSEHSDSLSHRDLLRPYPCVCVCVCVCLQSTILTIPVGLLVKFQVLLVFLVVRFLMLN